MCDAQSLQPSRVENDFKPPDSNWGDNKGVGGRGRYRPRLFNWL